MLMVKKQYIVVGAILLLVSIVSAVQISDVQITPNPWIEQTGENTYSPANIVISVKCTEANTSSSNLAVRGVVTHKDVTYQPIDFVYDSENDVFSLTYQTADPGSYSIDITCSYAGTTDTVQRMFNVKRLTGDVVLPESNPPYAVYVGQLFENPIEAELFVESNLKEPATNPTFKVYLEQFGQKYQLSLGPVGFNQNTKRFLLKPFVNYDYSSLDTDILYNLIIEVEYFDAGIKHNYKIIKRNVVKIQSPLDLEILDVNDGAPLEYSTAGTLKIHFSAFYNKNIIEDISQSDFYVYLMNENGEKTNNLEISDFSYNTQSGTGVVTAKLPQFEPGSYRLFLAMDYNVLSPIVVEAKSPIKFILPFHGKIVDADNHAVKGIIKLIKDGEVKQISTNELGEYSASILPGNYTLILQFDTLLATLNGVYIENGIEDAIRFDKFSGEADIPGISVASLVVLELSPEIKFSSADLEIYYDASKVTDEQRIEVYTCHNWNFDRRSCSDSWERIENPVVDTTRNIVKFNVSSFSSFVIGERKALHFDVTIPKKNYFMGEMVSISGKVLDSNGNPVEGATVEYSLGSTNETTKTDIGGFFMINVKAPMHEGSAKLSMRCEKEPFLPAESSVFLELSRKTELSLLAPETIDIAEGKTISTNITVKNTGQTNLTDITIGVDGVPPEWYQIIPTSISQMNPDDSINVELRFFIPKGYCASHECKKFYLINIAAQSAETQAQTTLTVQLLEKLPAEQSQEKETPTGFFTAIAGVPAVLIALITSPIAFINANWWIILIVIIVAFGFLIKYKKGSERGGLPNLTRLTGALPRRTPARQDTIQKMQNLKARISHEFKYNYRPNKKR